MQRFMNHVYRVGDAQMNRTGTYIAFDGLGQSDPTKSDFRYYAILQAWNKNDNIDFRFVNSHEKTYAVRDTSSKETLYKRIRQRMSGSKNMLIILSSDTRYTGSVLSYEIEQAIDVFKIPLIIAYPDYSAIFDVNALADMWPKSLADRIDKPDTRAIHIAFQKGPILDAINQFTVSHNSLTNGRNYYSQDAYKSWNLI